MEFLNFRKMMILSLVVILLISDQPFVDARGGSGMKITKQEMTSYEEHASFYKDIRDNGYRTGRVEGRKMLDEASNSKISGRGTTNDLNISPGSPFTDQLNYEKSKKLSHPNKQKPTKGVNGEASSSRNSGYSTSGIPKKEDSGEFLEVVDLIHKDYTGPARRHKPPINNHKPTD